MPPRRDLGKRKDVGSPRSQSNPKLARLHEMGFSRLVEQDKDRREELEFHNNKDANTGYREEERKKYDTKSEFDNNYFERRKREVDNTSNLEKFQHIKADRYEVSVPPPRPFTQAMEQKIRRATEREDWNRQPTDTKQKKPQVPEQRFEAPKKIDINELSEAIQQRFEVPKKIDIKNVDDIKLVTPSDLNPAIRSLTGEAQKKAKELQNLIASRKAGPYSRNTENDQKFINKWLELADSESYSLKRAQEKAIANMHGRVGRIEARNSTTKEINLGHAIPYMQAQPIEQTSYEVPQMPSSTSAQSESLQPPSSKVFTQDNFTYSRETKLPWLPPREEPLSDTGNTSKSVPIMRSEREVRPKLPEKQYSSTEQLSLTTHKKIQPQDVLIELYDRTEQSTSKNATQDAQELPPTELATHEQITLLRRGDLKGLEELQSLRDALPKTKSEYNGFKFDNVIRAWYQLEQKGDSVVQEQLKAVASLLKGKASHATTYNFTTGGYDEGSSTNTWRI